MAIKKLENAVREHTKERQSAGRIDMIPMDLYDVLEETIPHGLVIKLGELILKLKGVG